MKRHQVQASAASLAAIFVSYGALAQQAAVGVDAKANAAVATPAPAAAAPAPESPPPPPPAADPAPAPANNQAGMALPANANAATNNSDHDEMVGHLAVGYLGRSTIPVGELDANGNPTIAAPVPIIGVRYWLNPMLGLDLGAGLWVGKRTTDNTPAPGNTTTTVNGPKPTAFVLHAGVPLSLGSAKHFSFQIIPEMNFGYAKVSWDSPTNMSGTHFDIGARAGAEIHFGFMGIPQLSLIGSVGLLFQYDKLRNETSAAPAAGSNVVSTSQWSLGTTVNDNPWNIFVTNVGALYYF